MKNWTISEIRLKKKSENNLIKFFSVNRKRSIHWHSNWCTKDFCPTLQRHIEATEEPLQHKLRSNVRASSLIHSKTGEYKFSDHFLSSHNLAFAGLWTLQTVIDIDYTVLVHASLTNWLNRQTTWGLQDLCLRNISFL